MPEVWFVLGLAVGMVLTGFCAIGSFDRGAASVRRHTWNVAQRQQDLRSHHFPPGTPLASYA